MELHANRIEGASVPARAGGSFEVAAAGDGPGSRWARSTCDDVDRALGHLARGAEPWFERGARARRALLQRAARRLVEAPDPRRLAAAALGLGPGEVKGLTPGLEDALEVGAAAESGAGPGVAVARRSWCERLAGVARAAFAELAAGRALLLLSDGRAPALAERVTEALLAAGLPPSALALLHDDGDTVLRAAAHDARTARLRVSGHAGDAARVAPLLERAAAASGFGAGVRDVPPARDLTFEPVRSARHRVTIDDDAQQVAREVVRTAFGRLRTLSGQAAGRVDRVEVHPRRLSRFTSALLAQLEEGGAGAPLPYVERDLGAELEQVRSLGLDEGATLIHEARLASPRAGPGGRIARLVFTNVEPGMRLRDRGRPAPVLLLSRRTDGASE